MKFLPYFLESALALCISVLLFSAAKADDNVVSKILIPNANSSCNFTSSNDQKTLYLLCGGIPATEESTPQQVMPIKRFPGGRIWDHVEMRIYDISNPRDPKEISQYDCGYDSTFQIIVRNGLAYLKAAPAAGGFKIVDVHDPSHPKMLGHYDDISTWILRFPMMEKCLLLETE